MSPRLHVAFAIGALHNASGGAERVLVDVANGLHRRGYRVSVFTYQSRNGPSFYPLDYGIEQLDGRVGHVDDGGRSRLESITTARTWRRSVAAALWGAQYVPRIYRLQQLLRRAQPDVAVGFLPSTFPYLVAAAQATRTPVVASLHNVPDRDLGGDPNRWDQSPIDIWVRNRSLAMADAVTVLLPSFLDQLDVSVRRKAYVVPNMVEGFDNQRADVRKGPDNVILAVGRLAHAKDHATLIRAWSILEPRYPSWRVRIVGDGPLRRDLADMIRDRGLSRISIDPPRSDIAAAYTSANLLAMPSIHEGFGLVTAEAMRCGLPVVGFADCEGTNEIVIPGQNGILVDPGRDRARTLSVALSELIEDQALRVEMAASAPATVERFEADTVLDQWERVIAETCRGPVGARNAA